MNTSHLGGHAGIVHVDIGAMDWAIKVLGIKSARDIGCGPGHQVKHMLDRGLDAYGIDGDPTLNWGRPDKFIRHDYTTEGLHIAEGADLGWCVEVLEHIEVQYLPNVFDTFRDCEFVIVTAAPPGTEDSHHHVNCRDQEYWIEKFYDFGFDFAFDLTAELRSISTMERNFMRETGMVFVRNLELDKDADADTKEMDNPFTKEDDDVPNYQRKPNAPRPHDVIDEMTEAKLTNCAEVIAKIREELKENHDVDLDQETAKILIEEIRKEEEEARNAGYDNSNVPVTFDENGKAQLYHPITKEPLDANKDLVEEDGKMYIVTRNKNGTIRKGSKKLLSE